jgi:hypothetical protein
VRRANAAAGDGAGSDQTRQVLQPQACFFGRIGTELKGLNILIRRADSTSDAARRILDRDVRNRGLHQRPDERKCGFRFLLSPRAAYIPV